MEDNDLDGILEFMEIFKLRKGIVVTKNTMEQRKVDDKELYLIPAPILLSGIE